MAEATPPPAGPQAAPSARRLARAPTFRENFDSGMEELQRRLEPLRGAASSAVDEMAIFLDPGAIDEALNAQRPAEMPTTPSSKAVQAASEAQSEQQAEAKLGRLGGSLIDHSKIMLQDKMAFLLGVANLAFTAFWVGRWPGTYHYFWLVKDLVLFTLRYLTYRQQGMHYMMLEYCYAANLMGLFYLFCAPQSAVLRKFSFAVMTGPLMWSIVAMRNSLVFHDGDKMTTLLVHSSPALGAWCMRWHPRAQWTAGMTVQQLADFNTASWFDMAARPALLSIVWVAVYYLLIFVAVNKRIQARGYENMFTAMVTRPSARKGALSKLVLSCPERLQPLVYLGVHTFAAWVALLPTKIWFDYFWAHTAILVAILMWSAWNGANFYFRVFAKKVMQQQQGEKSVSVDAKKAS